MNLLALAENTEKQASYFQSNGDLINGWYWLRDSNLKHYAQWTFQNISAGSEDLVLNITALATDRPNGGRGFKAKFKLIYGFPGSGDMGGVFKTKTIILPNVSAPNDPSGYTCQGQVSIDRAFISGASTILVRVERESAGDNHVAFKEDSVTLTIEEPEEEQPLEENQLPETNTLEEATLIQPGNYTGSLGDKDQEGHRDNNDYYLINLEEGQLITLQLISPGNASYNLSLLNPHHSSRGSSTTQGDTKTLDYVADSSGSWYIRISRSSGEGEYQLSVDIEDQNDAGSGQDAGSSYQKAIPISTGTITGLLKAGDNDDYYSISLEEGQLITLQLISPGNASYNLSLLNPNRSSRGSSTTQGNVKTLDYVANSSGSWYIKISRSSGEGEYQLLVDIQNQDDAGSGQDAGDSYQEAIPISSGTFTGLLKAGDNADYYSISLQKGQQISLEFTIPGNASYNLSLLNPHHSSRGSSTAQGDTKTLDYVADSTGTWYIKVSRSSGEGEYQLSVDDFTSGFEGEENHPPIISSLVSSQNSVEANQTVDISCNASDGDGDTLTYNWTANGQSIGENTSSLNWVAPDTPGTYIITCTVSDSKGSQDSDSVSIIVIEPEDGSEQIPTQVLYQIKITTGTKMGAGTDANVYITLVGQNGQSSGEILLDNPGINDFERGDTNIFWINSIPIEGLDHIIIRHDNTGNFPGWYIEEVYIACPELNKDWFFYPRQWLATDEPPGYRTQGTFYPQQEEVQEDSEECLLSLTDSGRTLTSNLSIFVQEDEKGSEIDIDGDGILQEFEDQAMDLINPKFELDEDEDWFEHPEHHVVNFVRVFPYSKGNKQYVIFIYCVTWSRDYGRAGIAGHDGDVERVIMAYEATSESGKNLQLKYVFTSAHGGENDHSAVWDAWNRNCFTCGISFWPRDEEMCGQLVFENNILKLQISEDKHAIYPTKDCCEDVHLAYLAGGFVMEDCGEGDTKRFNCYNAGEPEYYLIDDLDNPSSWRGLSEEKRTSLTNLFSQEQVWSGNKSHPDKFCGGLGGEGSTSDLWMDSPGTIGSKLQSLPNSLTDKL